MRKEQPKRMKIAGIFLVVERRGHEKSKAPKKEKSVNPSFMPLWGRIRSTKKKGIRSKEKFLCSTSAFECQNTNRTERNIMYWKTENAGERKKLEKLQEEEVLLTHTNNVGFGVKRSLM